jgi:hypothetical protein
MTQLVIVVIVVLLPGILATSIADKLTVHSNLYTYFLSGKGTEWIYVRDKENNLTYEGRVAASSENEHVHELVLLDCTVYRYEDSAKLYSVPTTYLSREVGKLVIETIPADRLNED